MRRAVVTLALLALLLPADALGHAGVTRTSPSYRERLETAPRSVVLEFDKQVAQLPGSIRVYDAKGRVLSLPARVTKNGYRLVASVRELPRGPYTVRWHAISAGDGHVIAGVFTFGVRYDAPEPTDAYGAAGPTTAEHVVRWLFFVGLALLVGGLAFRLLVLPRSVPRALERRFFAVTGIGVVVVLEVGIVAFLLRAQDALQLPFTRFFYGDLSPIAGGTRFGTAFIAMTLGYALVAALLFLAWLLERRAFLWVAFVVATGFASGLSLSGHDGTGVASLADWVHLTAASVWAGGLVMLLCSKELQREAFLRFARLAPLLIAALLAAGVYLSIQRLPRLSDLWAESYGRVLLVKLGLVAVALAWGGFHHAFVRPLLDRPGVLSRLPRSLAGESAVGMAVLLVAAVLVDSQPPAQGTTVEPAASAASRSSPSRVASQGARADARWIASFARRP
jgi:copper transport protein